MLSKSLIWQALFAQVEAVRPLRRLQSSKATGTKRPVTEFHIGSMKSSDRMSVIGGLGLARFEPVD
jgi:hypothetical protein